MCSLLVSVQTESRSGQKMLCDLEHKVKGASLTGIPPPGNSGKWRYVVIAAFCFFPLVYPD